MDKVALRFPTREKSWKKIASWVSWVMKEGETHGIIGKALQEYMPAFYPNFWTWYKGFMGQKYAQSWKKCRSPEQAPGYLSEGFGLRAEAQGEQGILRDAQTFQADAEQAPGNVPVRDSWALRELNDVGLGWQSLWEGVVSVASIRIILQEFPTLETPFFEPWNKNKSETSTSYETFEDFVYGNDD